MKKYLILTGLLMAIAVGCSADVKSVEFYEKNDEARNQKLKECSPMGFPKDDLSKKEAEDCGNAQKAEANISKFNINITTFRTELASICFAQFSNVKECSEYVDKCFLDSLENSKSLLSYDEFIAIEEKCIKEYTSKNK